MSAGKKFLKILVKVLAGIFSAVLLAVLCITLILAQPQSDPQKEGEPQPLLTASPEITIREESDLRKLVESFPAPVMSFMSGSSMVFVSGSAADVPVSGGLGRVVTLYWQTADGEPLILQSNYPASALSLLAGGYHFSNITGPTLFGSPSVRMENADTVRIHAATDEGLYVMIVPTSLASRISALSRSLQLVTLSE